MTENKKAALAWAKQNESRANRLAVMLHESWRGTEEKARLSEAITCLLQEAERFRAYAEQA